MIFKNDNIGLLVGTFFGGIIGSVGTLLVLKKLNKLEANEELKKNEAKIEEVYKFYNEKIKELSLSRWSEEDQKEILESKKSEIKEEVSDTKVRYVNPKDIYVDNISEAKSSFDINEFDPADFNEGTNELESDRGIRIEIKNKNNYNKVYTSKSEKYANVEKAIERENEKEEIHYPRQITKENYEMSGGYVKEELIYYERNGIFAGLDDIPCDAYTENYFGLNNINLFGSEQASLDGKSGLFELYLRDDDLHIDFHIEYNGTEDFEKLIENKE